MTESPDRDDRTIDVPPADSPSAVSFECAGAAGDTAALSSQTVEFTPAGQPVDLPAGRWPDLDGAAVSGQTVDLAGGLPGDDAEATPAVPARATAPPGYELVSVLGRGGMGVVYKARQVALKRLVALKMVTAGAHASPGDLIRFQTEAEAVASLQHPNIVQIYEVGEYEGVPYFSLEYVDGGSLVQKLKDRPLRSREAARLLQTLARAIHYAHEHGVVHRDIKPANVLLMADGTPKVADFGLAKRVGGDAEAASQTQAGTILGTPNFMAPEQAEGEIHEIGPTADVYSLGAVLYHLLTGRPPFQAATMLETLQLVRTKEPVPLRQLQPSVPRDLETICLKCLQKAPARRYASAAALADDLGRFLADEPILARPVGQVERVGRWCRRNPRAAALSATVAVLLVSVGVLAAVMATRAGRERAAVADAGNLARLRLDQAANAAAQGDARRALDILNAPDHRVETAPVLAELRGEWSGLRGQVAWLADFKQRIDKARYAGLFGAPAPTPGRATPAQRQALAETQRTCLRALEMCPANSAGNPKPQIPNPNGENSDSGFRIRDLEFPGAGPPQMDAAQEQLLREDVFDAYLVAGEVEWKLALAAGTPDAQRQAARRILDWLDRAGAVLPPTRTLHAKRAFYRSALGEAEAAQTEQDKAEAITPGTAVDHFWQGVVERLLGEADRARNDEKQAEQHYRRAAAAYVEVLRLRPDHFWGYFEWANCQFRLKAPQEALVALTACTHIKPDAPWPYYNRGTILLNLKQYDAAGQDFGRTVERDPNYAEAYLNRGLCQAARNGHDAAVADFTRALEARPEGYPLASFQRAQSYRALKRYGEARDDYAAVLRDEPNRVDCYTARGVTNLLLKDFDSALEDYQQAIRLQPKNESAHYYVGIIHLGRRQYDLALPALNQAVALRPAFTRPYLARAQLRLWQGQPAEALEDVNTVLATLPPDKQAEVLNDRADVYRTLGRLDEAAADYRRATQLEPKRVDSAVGLALVLEKQGQSEQAKECYERLLAADPDSATAYLRRAEYRRDCGQFPEALADCDRAAKLTPGAAGPGLVWASIAAARGDDTRAVAEAERLLQVAQVGDGHALYAAACVWGLACRAAGTRPGGVELARRYADRAVALLGEALDKGFHDLLYEEHNRMPDDPALAALRSHPRFQELFGPRVR